MAVCKSSEKQLASWDKGLTRGSGVVGSAGMIEDAGGGDPPAAGPTAGSSANSSAFAGPASLADDSEDDMSGSAQVGPEVDPIPFGVVLGP